MRSENAHSMRALPLAAQREHAFTTPANDSVSAKVPLSHSQLEAKQEQETERERTEASKLSRDTIRDLLTVN